MTNPVQVDLPLTKVLQIQELLEAVFRLLENCTEIDPYSYHDAPSSPIHPIWAEAELRVLMEEVGFTFTGPGGVTKQDIKEARKHIKKTRETTR